MRGPGLLVLRNIETTPLSEATTNSGFPSPSRSQIAIPCEEYAVPKSTLGAKEDGASVPGVLMLRKIERTLGTPPAAVRWTTTKSNLPSPSRSPTAALYGQAFDTRSIGAANEFELKLPLTPKNGN